ncbi:GILT-like protein 1 isoform X2 [Hyposmocoma kahamanoa]|uniref:GILT-like protein 1 isoform X2 n=1 Tax=Hyposmocoma kahamanoa TaxID=1477025 RepID=UPI000E6D630B|nr:GILT-like protein 1 isoform X2 [Hyposmocoma kahamanoa]
MYDILTLAIACGRISNVYFERCKPLQLSVFYESLCTDSQAFLLQQLLPTTTVLHDFVNVRFIPFGKSKSIDYGENGFECQHGPAECLGNMVHDCVLDRLRPELEMPVLKRVEYVACELDNIAGATGNMMCVQKAGLDEDKVNKCLTSEKGLILQLDSEYQTEKLDPEMIPTVVLGDTFNQTFQDNALKNLMGTLCEILKYQTPCEAYFNRVALSTILTTYAINTVTGNETTSETNYYTINNTIPNTI